MDYICYLYKELKLTTLDGCYWISLSLTLKPLRVTGILYLLTISPLNQTLSHENEGNDQQPRTLDCETNSPFQNLMKCMENSMENMHTDVRV